MGAAECDFIATEERSAKLTGGKPRYLGEEGIREKHGGRYEG